MGCPERWSMPHCWKHSTSGWTGLQAPWSHWRCPCSLQGSWARWPLNIPSNPKHSMILWVGNFEKDTGCKTNLQRKFQHFQFLLIFPMQHTGRRGRDRMMMMILQLFKAQSWKSKNWVFTYRCRIFW